MESPSPFTEERPWGSFRQFVKNTPATVKVISVKKGKRLSLQYHHKRSEFWRVVSGHPEITVGEKVSRASAGDEFFVSIEARHRLAAPEDDIEILEIALGDFDEADIVRLEDDYGRA